MATMIENITIYFLCSFFRVSFRLSNRSSSSNVFSQTSVLIRSSIIFSNCCSLFSACFIALLARLVCLVVLEWLFLFVTFDRFLELDLHCSAFRFSRSISACFRLASISRCVALVSPINASVSEIVVFVSSMLVLLAVVITPLLFPAHLSTERKLLLYV